MTTQISMIYNNLTAILSYFSLTSISILQLQTILDEDLVYKVFTGADSQEIWEKFYKLVQLHNSCWKRKSYKKAKILLNIIFEVIKDYVPDEEQAYHLSYIDEDGRKYKKQILTINDLTALL